MCLHPASLPPSPPSLPPSLPKTIAGCLMGVVSDSDLSVAKDRIVVKMLFLSTKMNLLRLTDPEDKPEPEVGKSG